MKSIQIVGFTPLSVILAERFSYLQSDVNLVEQDSSSSLSIDTQWQNVSLLCLINLLKQCRMLLKNTSKKFGVNIHSVKMNEQLVYSYIKSATQCIQKYYLTLLQKRQVKFRLVYHQIENDEKMEKSSFSNSEEGTESVFSANDSTKSFERLLKNEDFDLSFKKPWQSYFLSSVTDTPSFHNEVNSTYVTYSHSSHPDFDRSLRLNAFHAIFQYLLQYPSVKLIGPDIFAFELAHLLSSLGHNQIYLYRMNPVETSILPMTETNTLLVTLFQVFSKFIHEPLIQTVSDETRRPTLHIIEQFHQFRMNLDLKGQLEYEKFIEPTMPTSLTPEESKKNKRTYLQTFRQQTQESLTKFSTSSIHTNTAGEIKEEEAPLNYFPPSSTFFVLTDINTPTNIKIHQKRSVPFPNAIRTFNSTPGSLIQNIYETLRTISDDKTVPHLTNIFLSVDHELCVLQNPTTIKNGEFGMDDIIESQQHNLQHPVENLHDLHKIIQRPINKIGQFALYESQLFENDALDLQSLLLLFNTQQEIPKNELMFLFHNEHNWHNLLVLPDCMTDKNNKSM